MSLGCQRYGLEQVDCCKPAFGQNGARVIILIFYLMNMLGWSGSDPGDVRQRYCKTSLEALGLSDRVAWLVGAGAGVAAGVWLSYVIATPRGVHLLSMFNSVITPALR